MGMTRPPFRCARSSFWSGYPSLFLVWRIIEFLCNIHSLLPTKAYNPPSVFLEWRIIGFLCNIHSLLPTIRITGLPTIPITGRQENEIEERKKKKEAFPCFRWSIPKIWLLLYLFILCTSHT